MDEVMTCLPLTGPRGHQGEVPADLDWADHLGSTVRWTRDTFADSLPPHREKSLDVYCSKCGLHGLALDMPWFDPYKQGHLSQWMQALAQPLPWDLIDHPEYGPRADLLLTAGWEAGRPK